MAIQLDTTVQKLHPGRFPNMSPKMAAIVGYLLGEQFTVPELEGLCVTSDGYCVGHTKGNVDESYFLGTFEDLERNWRELVGLKEVGLSEEEEIHCLKLLQTRITRFDGGG